MDKEDGDLGMKDEDGDSQILERMDKENADLEILGRVKNEEDPDSEKKMKDEDEDSEILDRLKRLKNKKDDRHWKNHRRRRYDSSMAMS
ncbi:unnamed protein product [Arabis nemorensis]|uniref:Uncharacterized protein n=1 Tax=Arabis nemorensis TaxID=586526 RepID=A0A565BUG8_9BRAS|nr:unnamed protein product [Arabis nemorensis]